MKRKESLVSGASEPGDRKQGPAGTRGAFHILLKWLRLFFLDQGR